MRREREREREREKERERDCFHTYLSYNPTFLSLRYTETVITSIWNTKCLTDDVYCFTGSLLNFQLK